MSTKVDSPSVLGKNILETTYGLEVDSVDHKVSFDRQFLALVRTHESR